MASSKSNAQICESQSTGLKTCSVCLQSLPVEMFSISSKKTGYRKTYCKKCASEKEKQRRLRNPEDYKKKRADRYRRDPCSAKRRAAEWAKKNPQRRREISLKYAMANMDKIARYKRENPEKFRAGRRRREMVRKEMHRQAGGFVTKEQRKFILSISFGTCIYCLAECKIAIDHFMPVSLGGITEIGNLVPCCGSCNSRKKDKVPEQWVIDSFGTDRLEAIREFLRVTPQQVSSGEAGRLVRLALATHFRR